MTVPTHPVLNSEVAKFLTLDRPLILFTASARTAVLIEAMAREIKLKSYTETNN